MAKAHGALVFPSVVSTTFVVGGEYSDGALRVGRETVGYYNTAAGSIGFQVGAQSHALVFPFMTRGASEQFRKRDGWSVGADATVAVVKVGANGAVDFTTATAPVQAFVLTNTGLMAGVSLEGTKVTRIRL
ncbi:lipid-binding SYLF domain-containing protein [Burkholderia ambifaria]|nr:lipid-binding SYLF domain-containing protein [Burkholderia ambifaria]